MCLFPQREYDLLYYGLSSARIFFRPKDAAGKYFNAFSRLCESAPIVRESSRNLGKVFLLDSLFVRSQKYTMTF